MLISADVFNFLNLVNRDWGINRETANFEQVSSLTMSGYDTRGTTAADRRSGPVYGAQCVAVPAPGAGQQLPLANSARARSICSRRLLDPSPSGAGSGRFDIPHTMAGIAWPSAEPERQPPDPSPDGRCGLKPHGIAARDLDRTNPKAERTDCYQEAPQIPGDRGGGRGRDEPAQGPGPGGSSTSSGKATLLPTASASRGFC